MPWPTFKPASGKSSAVTLSLVDGNLKSVQNPNNQTGITGQWRLNQNAQLDLAILGSIQALQDYVEVGGIIHPEMNYTVMQSNPIHTPSLYIVYSSITPLP